MAGGPARSSIHIVSFAIIITAAVYVILDLEFPRLGLIQVTAFDQALVDLLQSMQEGARNAPEARCLVPSCAGLRGWPRAMRPRGEHVVIRLVTHVKHKTGFA